MAYVFPPYLPSSSFHPLNLLHSSRLSSNVTSSTQTLSVPPAVTFTRVSFIHCFMQLCLSAFCCALSLFFLLHDKLLEDWIWFIPVLHDSCGSRSGETHAGKKGRDNDYTMRAIISNILFVNTYLWMSRLGKHSPLWIWFLGSLFSKTRSPVSSCQLTTLLNFLHRPVIIPFIIPLHTWLQLGRILPKQI